MRYIKVLLLVLLFFFVMLFFVQNQSAFAEHVILRMDLGFLPKMESVPMPIYTLMLICFVLGAFVVLLMLVWDRVIIAGKLTASKRKVASLEKKLEKTVSELAKISSEREASEEKLRADLADAENRLANALRLQGSEIVK
ncbi:MAG: LapA family protein [Mailhella sp.]|nr:LapA family protein [Mailhella sp.]